MQDKKQHTVVVINDDESLAMLTEMHLLRKGLNVLKAFSAEEAERLMKEHEAGGGTV